MTTREKNVQWSMFFPRPYPLPVGVRATMGEEMVGMEIFEDGLSFRSAYPYPCGKTLELILCKGAIVVDAEVLNCQSLPDERGGFVVRARYVDATREIQQLVCREADDMWKDHQDSSLDETLDEAAQKLEQAAQTGYPAKPSVSA